MRLRFISTIIVLFILMLGAVATASSPYPESAQIPFDFKVGDQELPAGRYELKRPGHDPRVVLMQNAVDPARLVFFITRITDVSDTIDQSQLVFYRYGDTVFLARIISRSDGLVRELDPAEPKCREQRERAVNSESCKFEVLTVGWR